MPFVFIARQEPRMKSNVNRWNIQNIACEEKKSSGNIHSLLQQNELWFFFISPHEQTVRCLLQLGAAFLFYIIAHVSIRRLDGVQLIQGTAVHLDQTE